MLTISVHTYVPDLQGKGKARKGLQTIQHLECEHDAL